MTPRVGDSFGIRAQNAIAHILYQTIEPVEYPYVRSLEEVDAMTRRGLRLRLQSAADKDGRAIRDLLMVQRNCAQLTTIEIMKWIGLEAHVKPHTCVCRTCGRRLR